MKTKTTTNKRNFYTNSKMQCLAFSHYTEALHKWKGGYGNVDKKISNCKFKISVGKTSSATELSKQILLKSIDAETEISSRLLFSKELSEEWTEVNSHPSSNDTVRQETGHNLLHFFPLYWLSYNRCR